MFSNINQLTVTQGNLFLTFASQNTAQKSIGKTGAKFPQNWLFQEVICFFFNFFSASQVQDQDQLERKINYSGNPNDNVNKQGEAIRLRFKLAINKDNYRS